MHFEIFSHPWPDKLQYQPLGQANKSMHANCAAFLNGYAPAKKLVIVATIAHPPSPDFKR